MSIAEATISCGRWCLVVAGVVVAMEGDPCRDGSLPENLYDPIPKEELAAATIGGRSAEALPRDVVRFFRGERWNSDLLKWVAEKINST